MNTLSEHSFVAPYRFTGLTALSVLSATTLLTLEEIAASTILVAPLTLVLINSFGLYSAAGTCFKAAAWIT